MSNKNNLHLDESITAQSPWIFEKFFSAFPALKHRNYKFYFTGQFISLIGTWLQWVAFGWLVLELTNSAFLIGLVSAVSAFPALVFSLLGGVIVDRFETKKIILVTQISEMFLAFIMGVLTIYGLINIHLIIIISFLLGLVHTLDNPARHTFAVEMVGKKDLSSAIALNSGLFNAARIIGPGIAGIIIAVFGTGGAFILNALSYLAVLLALLYIKVENLIPDEHPHPIEAIKEGIRYSFSNQTIKLILLFVGVMSIFGWSYTVLMPLIVQNVFQKGAESLGYFYSSAGLGAVLGMVILSAFSKKIKNQTFLFGGALLFCLSLILFTLTTNFNLALFFLFFAGLGLISTSATLNSIVQHVISDNLRGRVMSIYSLMFLGMMPLGSFVVGVLGEHFGANWAIRIDILVLLVALFYLYRKREQITSF